MARVIWKGSISFGLVHVPVGLYPAEQSREIHFSMLDKEDLAPVGYRRYNKRTGEEVEWDRIVKGYEYDKGQYVVLDEEDFKQADVKATQTVDIQDFVDAADIPLTYYDKPYYLEPQKGGDKVYALLREVLARTGKVGIAKVVLRSRQHLAALIPRGRILVLELLRFADELRSPEEIRAPEVDPEGLGISEKEMDMAVRLVEGMAEPWEPGRYRDTYTESLLRLIEEKVSAGGVRRPEAAEEAPAGGKVIDLMAQLKQSLEQTKGRGGGAKPRAGGRTAGQRSKVKPKGEGGDKPAGRSRRQA
jgi:DNA end-binding protein Ku